MDSLFWLIVGYVVSTVFPVPFLQRAILDGWNRLWAWGAAKLERG